MATKKKKPAKALVSLTDALSTFAVAAKKGLAGPAKKPKPKPKQTIFKPNRALAMCSGPEPRPIGDLASDLAADLEEMRWDVGSAALKSPLIPKLSEIGDEAGGDPNDVTQESLEALVKQNATAAKSRQHHSHSPSTTDA